MRRASWSASTFRPVNFDRSQRDTLRVGFDFSKPLKSQRPSQAVIDQLRQQFLGAAGRQPALPALLALLLQPAQRPQAVRRRRAAAVGGGGGGGLAVSAVAWRRRRRRILRRNNAIAAGSNSRSPTPSRLSTRSGSRPADRSSTISTATRRARLGGTPRHPVQAAGRLVEQRDRRARSAPTGATSTMSPRLTATTFTSRRLGPSTSRLFANPATSRGGAQAPVAARYAVPARDHQHLRRASQAHERAGNVRS